MFQPGSHIDRYEVERRIGRGGMGAVYAARDPVLGRMVAIKVFEGDIDAVDGRERFSREARAAAALSHPGIVTVFDFGACDAQPYIVMEWVTGETLASVIRRRADVSLADKLRWIEEVCAGAAYAHRRSVVHRDIKPANLMLDASGRLRILDFGIARMLGTASTTQSILGTPGYMAPEQIEGSTVDHRADIFAIGVVLYELLAYIEAFPGETAVTISHRIMTQDPRPLTEIVPALDAAVVDICTRALKKDPAERFQQADDMRVSIARVREGLATSETVFLGPAFASGPAAAARDTGADTPERRPPPPTDGARTPTPAPRRTDREALARRRAESLNSSLEEARGHLARGALDDALDACQRALTFDETHTGALELEQQILEALGTPPSPARDPHDPAIAAQLAAAASADGTVMIPPRQLPSAQAALASALETSAPSRAAAPHVLASAAAPADGAPTAPRPAWRPRQLTRRPRAVLVAAGVGLLALAAVLFILIPSGPLPTGTLVIDAAPWASVAAIESLDGEPVPLPTDAATPLTLELPAGSYRVRLNGPPPASRQEEMVITVAENGTNVAPAVRFESVTVEEYFESYLTGAAPSVEQP